MTSKEDAKSSELVSIFHDLLVWNLAKESSLF